MKTQGTLALVTIMIAFGQAGSVQAQALPPMYGPPVYEAQGAYPPPPPPRYVRSAPGPLFEEPLLPQEIVGILQSTGYAPLGLPVRHGRFYVVAALHPNGDDGRVTIDAISGRFVRFVPANEVRGIDENIAVYAPPPAVGAPVATMPPRPGGLRPPTSLPKVASRSPAATPIPAPRPTALAKQDASMASAVPQPSKTAENSQVAKSAETKPAENKPVVQLLPTQPTPPVQGLE